ncbi:hydroxyneurosporene-O-methyltransferase [Winogradskya humida]|uniref:Hydroxyneurosporene-O-methyltransferase n=1 Tax=Winogradskya humida TaxID=113566 RepID=A0ABQ4A590_9ACTN|nr:hydroxyneurosporene-O-methyltransferase [Actinoplanes humidus]
MMELSLGTWISASIGVAARLGVADVLAAGPKTADALAEAIGVRPEAITPVLDALTMVGVFARDEDGRYLNSESSEQLRTDHPQSMRYMSMLLTGLYAQGCGSLLEAVQTNKPALTVRYGVGLYEYLEKDAETAQIFDKAMQEVARPVAGVLAQHLPLANARTVVDVGGGNGELLKGILAVHPHLRGICVDRADTCARAEAALRESGDADLIERLTFEPADIFQECPRGGDVYLLKNVLHDWNSESAVQILSSISAAMRDRDDTPAQPPMLVVMDPVREYDAGAALRPLIKLVIGEQGTRDRSEADIRRETAAAGLQVVSITPMPADLAAVACVLAP